MLFSSPPPNLCASAPLRESPPSPVPHLRKSATSADTSLLPDPSSPLQAALPAELTCTTGETYLGHLTETTLAGQVWLSVISLAGHHEHLLAPGTVTRIRLLTPAELNAYAARPQVEDIVSSICTPLAISETVVMSGDRHQSTAECRFLIWHVLYKLGYTTNQIARAFKRDHGAICNGLRRAKDILSISPRLQALVTSAISQSTKSTKST